MRIDTPGPQPHNAGITPGHRVGDHTDPRDMRIADLEGRLARVRMWAKRMDGRVRHLEGVVSDLEKGTVAELHKLILALADRCAGQSEALTKRAEK